MKGPQGLPPEAIETKFKGYFVSPKGDVFNTCKHKNTKFICTKYVDKDGYFRVWINRKFIPVHRLVALTFINENAPHLVVNHKDGIRTNNCLENLELITAKENEIHARKILGKRLLGEKASRSKLKNNDVFEIRKLIENNIERKIIAEKFSVSVSTVRRIQIGHNWSHL
jgi:HNH endonuclease